MFDTSAKAHIILALNRNTIEADKDIIEQWGFHILREFIGMYKGVTENSYLIPCYDLLDCLKAYDMAREYEQESVRVNMRASVIMLNDANAQPVTGIFRSVGMHTPNKDAWTLDKELHEYYTIENIK